MIIPCWSHKCANQFHCNGHANVSIESSQYLDLIESSQYLDLIESSQYLDLIESSQYLDLIESSQYLDLIASITASNDSFDRQWCVFGVIAPLIVVQQHQTLKWPTLRVALSLAAMFECWSPNCPALCHLVLGVVARAVHLAREKKKLLAAWHMASFTIWWYNRRNHSQLITRKGHNLYTHKLESDCTEIIFNVNSNGVNCIML